MGRRTAKLGKGDPGGGVSLSLLFFCFRSFVPNPSFSLGRPALSHMPGSSILPSPLSSSSSLPSLGERFLTCRVGSHPVRGDAAGVGAAGVRGWHRDSIDSSTSDLWAWSRGRHQFSIHSNSIFPTSSLPIPSTARCLQDPYSPPPLAEPDLSPKDEQGWARGGGSGGKRRGRRGGPLMTLTLGTGKFPHSLSLPDV